MSDYSSEDFEEDFDLETRRSGLGKKWERDGRTRQKERAMLGVFGSDEEEEGGYYNPELKKFRVPPKNIQFVGKNERLKSKQTVTSSDILEGTHDAPKKKKEEGGEMPKMKFNTTGFGAKMLEKMGYKKGQGLGANAEGIASPVESKLRPERVGLGAVRERTEKERREAVLRGEISDSEDEEIRQKRERESKKKKRSKENLISSSELSKSLGDFSIPPVLASILDAGISETKRIELTSSVSKSGAEANDKALTDSIDQLSGLAHLESKNHVTNWQQLQARKAYIKMEKERISNEYDKKNMEISRLGKLLEKVDEIHNNIANMAVENVNESVDELEKAIQPLTYLIETLPAEFSEPNMHYELDSVAVSILMAVVSEPFKNWDVFRHPYFLLEHFLTWRKSLQSNDFRPKTDRPDAFMDMELETEEDQSGQTNFTHYESLMMALWETRVSKVLRDDWNSRDTSKALHLLEAWDVVVPSKVKETLVKDTILPKLKEEVSIWKPSMRSRKRSTDSLHHWIFPWLPYLGNFSNELLSLVLSRLSRILSEWDIGFGPLDDFSAWRFAFTDDMLDRVLEKTILPKLEKFLQEKLVIDPSNQDMNVILTVLAWKDAFRATVFGKLLIDYFFPKWLMILYEWLTLSPNFEEASEWYRWWKSFFPEDVSTNVYVQQGFSKGLDMMNESLENKTITPPTSYASAQIQHRLDAHEKKLGAQKLANQLRDQSIRQAPETISFREIVEDFCADQGFLLVPLRKSHPLSGNALFRISAQATRSRGITVYLKNDIIWMKPPGATEDAVFQPIGFEEIPTILNARPS
ncbi:RNA-binding splicing factor [Schizosaccharomyces octosporus yFS286]|uniref:RNA-binding splicing factor n=1 Tax=Schizosaccharomyces octosporus (strain yFS286) TaxID=483514 RepID=S9PV49_SCHOY|nr:RNA-binding splicing factor [Schizosaccharomyces octosporus yFS286]EPX71388.1 RNA-binding splicing factor [Schizosaccharomyces octosporus yFS286]